MDGGSNLAERANDDISACASQLNIKESVNNEQKLEITINALCSPSPPLC
jgi:hypothetical protein